MLSVQGQIKAARSDQTPKAIETFIWTDPQPGLLRKQEVVRPYVILCGIPHSAVFIFLLI